MVELEIHAFPQNLGSEKRKPAAPTDVGTLFHHI